MNVIIKQFIGGKDWESDCYIISDFDVNNNCIIIDPGAEDISEYTKYVSHYELIPSIILITHRHFDHFAGVNELRSKYPFVKLFCSVGCNDAIQNPRLNCSVLTNRLKAIVVEQADIVFNGRYSFNWNGHMVHCVPTPGHTDDSISVIFENNIFTGDALLRDYPTVTKLPSGNEEQQEETEKYIRSLHGYSAWPGHGEAFVIE